MVKVVASAEAEILTILFPTRMVLSILLYLDRIFITEAAFLSPSSARPFIFSSFSVVKAVSQEEKKADNATKIISAINCIQLLVSKIHFLSVTKYILK